AGQRGALLELAGVLATHAADRRVALGALPVDLAELARHLIERDLAQLDLGLGVVRGLARCLGLAAGRARGLELVAGEREAIGSEGLGRRQRRIIDQQELAERAEPIAPRRHGPAGARHGGGSQLAEPGAIAVALAIARGDRRELR